MRKKIDFSLCVCWFNCFSIHICSNFAYKYQFFEYSILFKIVWLTRISCLLFVSCLFVVRRFQLLFEIFSFKNVTEMLRGFTNKVLYCNSQFGSYYNTMHLVYGRSGLWSPHHRVQRRFIVVPRYISNQWKISLLWTS